MNIRKYSSQETLQYAIEAKEYVHNVIKKGNTQLENNNLPKLYKDSINTAVGDIRDNERISANPNANPLISATLASFEQVIAYSSKYSIGNCEEHAIVALDYILNHVPGMYAEVYRIVGGDHVILVLNRDPNSNPSKPEEWGDDVIICDPWAKKVYKASEYLSELKNCQYSWFWDENYAEDFDPDKHTLSPLGNFNTLFLQSTKQIPNLKKKFLDESNHLIRILRNYKYNLNNEKTRITDKYGDNDERAIILAEKIKLIKKAMKSTEDNANHCANCIKPYSNDYQQIRSYLEEAIKSIKCSAVHAMQFSDDEKKKLYDLKGDDADIIRLLKFFGKKSITRSHLEELGENVNKQLANRK